MSYIVISLLFFNSFTIRARPPKSGNGLSVKIEMDHKIRHLKYPSEKWTKKFQNKLNFLIAYQGSIWTLLLTDLIKN